MAPEENPIFLRLARTSIESAVVEGSQKPSNRRVPVFLFTLNREIAHKQKEFKKSATG